MYNFYLAANDPDNMFGFPLWLRAIGWLVLLLIVTGIVKAVKLSLKNKTKAKG